MSLTRTRFNIVREGSFSIDAATFPFWFQTLVPLTPNGASRVVRENVIDRVENARRKRTGV